MTTPNAASARYVDIATRRFAEAGFHGVSLAALARDAGVSKQALLHFFGTKERLYAAVLHDLSARLLADLDAAEGATPEDRLVQHFSAQLDDTLAGTDNARLVIRALLDSDASAQTWPLRAYLDRLVALLKRTEKWADAPEAEALAALYRLIGMIQYFAISQPTLTGMYGADTLRPMRAAFDRDLRATVGGD